MEGEVDDDATASFVLEHEQLERRDRTNTCFSLFFFALEMTCRLAPQERGEKVTELCFWSRKAINNRYAEYTKIRESFSGCEERAGGDQNTASPQQQAGQRDRVEVT